MTVLSVEFEAAVAARRADFQALRAEARRVEGLAGEVPFVLIPAGWVTLVLDQLEERVARAGNDGDPQYLERLIGLLAEMRHGATLDAPDRVSPDHYETLLDCMGKRAIDLEDKLSVLNASREPHEPLSRYVLAEEIHVIGEFWMVLRPLLC